jgi:hypothetical protein
MDALLHLCRPAQEHSPAPSAPPAPSTRPVPRDPAPAGRRGSTPADYATVTGGRLAPGTKWQNEATSVHDARSVRDARLSLRHTYTGFEIRDYRLEEGDGVLRRVEEQPHRNLPGQVCADAQRGDNQDAGQWTVRSKLAHRPIHLQDCWLEEREGGWERTMKPVTVSPLGGTAKAMRHAAGTTLRLEYPLRCRGY